MASFVKWIILFYKFFKVNIFELVLIYPSSYQYPFRIPFYEVIGLDEGKSYKFRVSAENAEGRSVPLETDMNVVPKNPYGLKKFNI